MCFLGRLFNSFLLPSWAGVMARVPPALVAVNIHMILLHVYM